MAGGHYVFFDLRGVQKTGSQQVGAGAILPKEIAAGLVDIAIKLRKHATRRHSLRVGDSMNWTKPDTLLTRRPDSVFHASDRNSVGVDVLLKKVFVTAMSNSALREDLTSIFDPDDKDGDQLQLLFLRYEIEVVSAEQLSALQSLSGMFWVYLNPSIGSYDKASVLGPALVSNYRDCVRLPYYAFRWRTLGSKDCDSNVILRKRTGLHDAMLLNNFIQ